MHIVFLSHYFPPEVNAPATRTFEHCRRWVASGHRVTVVTCAPNCPSGVVFDGYSNAWKSEEQVAGIRVVRVWTFLSRNAGFLRRIISFCSYMVRATLFAMTLRDADVVVATSPQFFCGWAGVLCKWLRRWPLVLEVRDIWPESIVTVGAMKRSTLIRLLEWLELRMYAAANHIVTLGEGYKRQLMTRDVPAEKITVIPNGVDISRRRSNATRAAVRGKFVAKDHFVCAYVGTIGMAHGLSVILDAAEKLQATGQDCFRFWIVGDGADRVRLEREASERHLTNVLFTGLVSKEQVAEILAAIDVCLVHLRGTELFSTVIPSKIFEIMAANVPIVMGVRGEAHDIVLDAGAGIAMTPDCANSLIECLHEVADNPGRYQRGREFVERHFNRDELARQMLAVIGQQVCPDESPTLDQPAHTHQAAEPQSRRAA